MPVSKGYFHYHLRRHGVDLDRVRRDRILHEALTAGPDPLHLSLVFNLSHTTASRYATIAKNLLDGQLEQPAESPSRPQTGKLPSSEGGTCSRKR